MSVQLQIPEVQKLKIGIFLRGLLWSGWLLALAASVHTIAASREDGALVALVIFAGTLWGLLAVSILLGSRKRNPMVLAAFPLAILLVCAALVVSRRANAHEEIPHRHLTEQERQRIDAIQGVERMRDLVRGYHGHKGSPPESLVDLLRWVPTALPDLVEKKIWRGMNSSAMTSFVTSASDAELQSLLAEKGLYVYAPQNKTDYAGSGPILVLTRNPVMGTEHAIATAKQAAIVDSSTINDLLNSH